MVHFAYTAIEINECAEGLDGCAQICTDTVTSYRCSCNSGFRLAIDGHTCNGKCFIYIVTL